MWIEDEKTSIADSSQMVDVAFRINCKTLPYDHAFSLSSEILKYLPWLRENNLTGIQTLHGPDSGNGWTRAENEEIFLSKRTRLIIRVPKSDFDKTCKLEGETLEVLGNNIKVGSASKKPFLTVRDLICRFVLTDDDLDESEFLKYVAKEFEEHNIHIRKAICGKTKYFTVGGNKKFTRSLMIADLSKENSIKLQDVGVGIGRIFGCGIFLPHKSIDAVANFKED
mgnify:FL=1|tara:strand:- start:334 stop:1008 length:675 start_codon:yes stop_codon:yes gene_type:complete